MAWRNQGITGSNNIPLGKRRFGTDADDAPKNGTDSTTNNSISNSPNGDIKRGRSPERSEVDGMKRRRKRHRWGDATENKAAGLMGLPTAILADMTSEQLEAYTLHLRIEEITQKLKINDVVPAEKDRSPSPPPQYDNHGRRINTREYRYRKRLEDERHKLVEKAIKTIPNYHPPSDYRRPTKTTEKVYVPVNDYPEINFIGLLIGPRGNTLKKMEAESGAKIAIRGKGSVKEGKGRSDAAHSSNQEEDLHCLIMADSEDKVNKAKALIHNVIETAASIPEGQNELKRNQLRELAALNGTLRDDENQACQNCGQIGHRKYDCPERQNYTASIICRVCGNAGHMARDCPDRQRGSSWRNDGPRAPARLGGTGDAVDREYEQLMRELGGTGAAPARIEAGPSSGGGGGGGGGGDAARPWQRGPTGAPAPWRVRNHHDREDGAPPSGPSGGPAPWARDRDRDRDRDSRPPWQRGPDGGRDGADSYHAPGQAPYGAAPPPAPGATAPWHQPVAPPPAPPAYGAYPGYGAYGAPPGLGAAPPGLPPPPPPPGAPPGAGAAAVPGLAGGLNALIQHRGRQSSFIELFNLRDTEEEGGEKSEKQEQHQQKQPRLAGEYGLDRPKSSQQHAADPSASQASKRLHKRALSEGAATEGARSDTLKRNGTQVEAGRKTKVRFSENFGGGSPGDSTPDQSYMGPAARLKASNTGTPRNGRIYDGESRDGPRRGSWPGPQVQVPLIGTTEFQNFTLPPINDPNFRASGSQDLLFPGQRAVIDLPLGQQHRPQPRTGHSQVSRYRSVSSPSNSLSLADELRRHSHLATPPAITARYITSVHPPTNGNTNGQQDAGRSLQPPSLSGRHERRVKSDPLVSPPAQRGFNFGLPTPRPSHARASSRGSPNPWDNITMSPSLRPSPYLNEDGTPRIIPGSGTISPRRPPAAMTGPGSGGGGGGVTKPRSQPPQQQLAQQQAPRQRRPRNTRTPHNLSQRFEVPSSPSSLQPSECERDKEGDSVLFPNVISRTTPGNDTTDQPPSSNSGREEKHGQRQTQGADEAGSSSSRGVSRDPNSEQLKYGGRKGHDDTEAAKSRPRAGTAQARAVSAQALGSGDAARSPPGFTDIRRHSISELPIRSILKRPSGSGEGTGRGSGIGSGCATSSDVGPSANSSVAATLGSTINSWSSGGGSPSKYAGSAGKPGAAVRDLHTLAEYGSGPDATVNPPATSNNSNGNDAHLTPPREDQQQEEEEDYLSNYTDDEAAHMFAQTMRRLNPLVPLDPIRQAHADEAARVIVASCAAGMALRRRELDQFSRAFARHMASPPPPPPAAAPAVDRRSWVKTGSGGWSWSGSGSASGSGQHTQREGHDKSMPDTDREAPVRDDEDGLGSTDNDERLKESEAPKVGEFQSLPVDIKSWSYDLAVPGYKGKGKGKAKETLPGASATATRGEDKSTKSVPAQKPEKAPSRHPRNAASLRRSDHPSAISNQHQHGQQEQEHGHQPQQQSKEARPTTPSRAWWKRKSLRYRVPQNSKEESPSHPSQAASLSSEWRVWVWGKVNVGEKELDADV
ncbi:hypothetical protein VTJ49DRAFT_6320 [Mycothermus thermophilus]|uniref:Branchpoint-bridging protein n=1 Tax=Humicola insolens TaxID=85995 RepID=A0ABR3VJ72_HUMIN